LKTATGKGAVLGVEMGEEGEEEKLREEEEVFQAKACIEAAKETSVPVHSYDPAVSVGIGQGTVLRICPAA